MKLINAKALKGLVNVPTPEDKSVDNKIRKDWNDYVSFLEKRGLRGNPNLDRGDMAFKMIEEYRKLNPQTSISKENIIPIQKEFQKYREYALAQIKAKKASFAPNTNESNFMKELSIVDGIPGQRTTSFAFPEHYLKTFVDDKLVSNANLGFATANKK